MKKSVIALVVVAAAAGGLFYANMKAEDAIKQQITQANESYRELAANDEMPLIAISYDDVSANILTSTYSIQGLDLTVGEMGSVVTIEKITATGVNPKKLADKGSMQMTGLKAAPAALQMLPPHASAFVQGLELHGDYDYEYQNDGTLLFKQTTSVNDEFSLGYSFTLVQMQQLWQYAKDISAMPAEEQQALTSNPDYPQLMLEKLMTGALNKGEIVITNNGFIERLLELASSQGQSPDLETIRGMALMNVSAAEQLPQPFKESLIAFINKPEKLTLNFSFDQPLPFAQLQNGELAEQVSTPEAMIEFANLKLTAN